MQNATEYLKQQSHNLKREARRLHKLGDTIMAHRTEKVVQELLEIILITEAYTAAETKLTKLRHTSLNSQPPTA